MNNPFRFDTECPLEIWHLILDFACDEGSLPAIFLSQVSRRFHKMCQGHLHHIKIGSTLELLELDAYLRDGPHNPMAAPRAARFLSIVLRHSAEEELDLLFEQEPSDGESDDGWYQSSSQSSESDDDDDGDGSSSPSSDDDDYEYQDVSETEMQEVDEELKDVIEYQKQVGKTGRVWSPMGDIEEMKVWPIASIHRECDTFKAIRRLLDACADTLEVLSIHFKPRNIVPHCLLFPSLPVLKRLTIVLADSVRETLDYDGNAYSDMLFPSLEIFRFSTRLPFDTAWCEQLLRLTPVRDIRAVCVQNCLRGVSRIWWVIKPKSIPDIPSPGLRRVPQADNGEKYSTARLVLIEMVPLPQPYPPGLLLSQLWQDLGYWEKLWVTDIYEVESASNTMMENTSSGDH